MVLPSDIVEIVQDISYTSAHRVRLLKYSFSAWLSLSLSLYVQNQKAHRISGRVFSEGDIWMERNQGGISPSLINSNCELKDASNQKPFI